MTVLALPQANWPQWSWPRIGALSGTLSLHVVAILLLLVPPTAMTLLRPAVTEVFTARIVEPPPKIEEPKLPVPLPIVREVRRKPTVIPVQAPVAPPLVESSMHSQVADPGPPAIQTAPTAPIEVAPTELAYNRRTPIPYPRDAAQQHLQGTVILRVLVGTDGTAQTIEIEKSSGSRSLDNAARNAVSHWTFQAGTRGGIATALWARVPITFTLQQL